MLISDYAAARHLASRLEIGVDDDLSRQRVGQSVDAVFQSMLPPAGYMPPEPNLTPWEQVGIFYTSPIEMQRDIMDQARMDGDGLTAWWLEQLHKAPYPLLERMTLFWHNHFTSDIDKVTWPQFMYRQNQLLRKHALGNFAELLHEIAKDPAMLVFLDGSRNVAKSPNENFARELLELFTLGVGHYSEEDIINVARAFSGWGVNLPAGSFVFKEKQHDNDEKSFLGRKANLDGADILNILLQEPRTAEYIAEKFWAEFINHDTPDPIVIKVWGNAFRDSGYEVTALLKAIIHSQVFWEPRQRGTLIKSPVEFGIGLLRELKLSLTDYGALRIANQQLGQDLFRPPDVKGWRGGKDWINNTRLIRRYDLIPKLLAEHTGDIRNMLVESIIEPKLAVGSKQSQARGLFKSVLERFSCHTNTMALANWLLPINPVAMPDCNQPMEKILQVLLKDPTYQLR